MSQPIQTMRSAHEEDCARQLQDLGLTYLWEPHTYQLWTGEWYLPDFIVAELFIFIEVKGPYAEQPAKPLRLMERLPESFNVILWQPQGLHHAHRSNATGWQAVWCPAVRWVLCDGCEVGHIMIDHEIPLCHQCGKPTKPQTRVKANEPIEQQKLPPTGLFLERGLGWFTGNVRTDAWRLVWRIHSQTGSRAHTFDVLSVCADATDVRRHPFSPDDLIQTIEQAIAAVEKKQADEDRPIARFRELWGALR
jgi:hypothetical protein